MSISSFIVFFLSCVVFYFLGNSLWNLISKLVKKIKTKSKSKIQAASASVVSTQESLSVKVGEEIESNS